MRQKLGNKRRIFLNVDQNDIVNMQLGGFSCNWPGDNRIRREN